MSNLFAKAKSFLVARMKRAAGRDVTYTRSGYDSLTLTAWPDNTLFAVGVGEIDQARVHWGERDYIVPAADLKLDGVNPFEPAVGDRITETLPVEGSMTFEVMRIPNEPAWRWEDEARTMYRIHVKRVSWCPRP